MPPPSDKLRCGAGSNYIVINADLSISFCGLLRQPQIAYKDTASLRGLRVMTALRLQLDNTFQASKCAGCELLGVCLGCPALWRMETGSDTECGDYFRQLAVAKVRHLESIGWYPFEQRQSDR